MSNKAFLRARTTCGRVVANAKNLCEPVTLDYTCGICGASFKTEEALRNNTGALSHDLRA
jgi:hypothetical protein